MSPIWLKIVYVWNLLLVGVLTIAAVLMLIYQSWVFFFGFATAAVLIWFLLARPLRKQKRHGYWLNVALVVFVVVSGLQSTITDGFGRPTLDVVFGCFLLFCLFRREVRVIFINANRQTGVV